MATKSERARAVARRVADRIAAVVPADTGLEPGVWEAVDSTSDRFMEALERWESNADPVAEQALRDEVTAAANDVIAAWRSMADVASASRE